MAFMILKGGILRRIEKYMADFPEDFFLLPPAGVWKIDISDTATAFRFS